MVAARRTPTKKRLLYKALLGVALLLAFTGRARAEVALVLNAPLDGAISPAEKTGLEQAVSTALKSQQFELVDAGERDSIVNAEPQLKDCYSELCLERLGRLAAAQIVVRYRAKLTQPPGADNKAAWRLNVEVLDVEVGAFGANLTEECPACTGSRAADKLADLLKRAVIESASRPRAALEVRTLPGGAAVFIDGTELGITPYKRPTFVGIHKVVVRHTGFITQQLDVEVADGDKKRVDVKLTSGSDPVEGGKPVYKKWWFWVAIGGAAAVAAGITAGVIVATRSDNAVAPDRNVPPNNFVFAF